MAEAIGPGTPLICVSAPDPFPRNPAYRLTLGALYTVQRVYEAETWKDNGGKCPECGSRMYVVIRQRPHWGYSQCRFRPLNDGDTSLVDAEEEIFVSC